MKKLIFGLPVFLTAFILGYVTAQLFLPSLDELRPTVAAGPSAPIPEPPAPPSVEAPTATTSPALSDQLETIDEVNDMNVDVPPKYSIKLLETGEGYPDEDAAVKNGQKWLGLFASNGEYFLRWTKVKVVRPTTPESSVDDEDYSWVRIKSPGETEPLFLTKNAPMLKEGKITTAFRGLDAAWANRLFENGIDLSDSYTTLNDGFYKNFWIGDNSCILSVHEAKNRNGERIFALFLDSGSIHQVLYTVNANYGQIGQLYWVGDLDQDGNADIYCDLNGSRALFLSSQADEGKLVKRVAQFYWIDGC
jgi:hypothetical protein